MFNNNKMNISRPFYAYFGLTPATEKSTVTLSYDNNKYTITRTAPIHYPVVIHNPVPGAAYSQFIRNRGAWIEANRTRSAVPLTASYKYIHDPSRTFINLQPHVILPETVAKGAGKAQVVPAEIPVTLIDPSRGEYRINGSVVDTISALKHARFTIDEGVVRSTGRENYRPITLSAARAAVAISSRLFALNSVTAYREELFTLASEDMDVEGDQVLPAALRLLGKNTFLTSAPSMTQARQPLLEWGYAADKFGFLIPFDASSSVMDHQTAKKLIMDLIGNTFSQDIGVSLEAAADKCDCLLEGSNTTNRLVRAILFVALQTQLSDAIGGRATFLKGSDGNVIGCIIEVNPENPVVLYNPSSNLMVKPITVAAGDLSCITFFDVSHRVRVDLLEYVATQLPRDEWERLIMGGSFREITARLEDESLPVDAQKRIRAYLRLFPQTARPWKSNSSTATLALQNLMNGIDHEKTEYQDPQSVFSRDPVVRAYSVFLTTAPNFGKVRSESVTVTNNTVGVLEMNSQVWEKKKAVSALQRALKTRTMENFMPISTNKPTQLGGKVSSDFKLYISAYKDPSTTSTSTSAAETRDEPSRKRPRMEDIEESGF